MDLRVRPIKSNVDYERMVAIVDALIDADPGSEEFETLQIASDLVWGWELKNVVVPPPDPIEAIKHRLDAMGLTLDALKPYIGSDALVNEIMAGKRELTLKMIRALHTHFGIPLESLVHEREVEPAVDYRVADVIGTGS